MDFERRAQKAYDRGEPARAVVVLVEGLKSRPGREGAGELLAEIYIDGIETPGLERDVASALAVHPEGERLASRIDEQLEASGREAMARDFRRAADELELEVSNPQPSRPPHGEPSTIDGDAGAEERSEEAGADDERRTPEHSADSHDGDGTTKPIEASGEASEAAEDTGEQSVEESGAEPEVAGGKSGAGDDSDWWPVGGAAAVGLVVLAAAAFGVWERGWRFGDAGHRRLGERLRALDATEPNAVEAFDTWAAEQEIADDIATEGRAVIHALRALEKGEAYEFRRDPETPWGYSARSLSALSRGELQEAVRFETELDRKYRSKGLVRRWTSARVAEERGKLERASRLYRRARETAPEFVPAITGGLRTAYARLDGEAIRRLLKELRSRRADHPYRRLQRIELPSVGLPDSARGERGRSSTDGPEEASDYDSRFLSLAERYASASDAAENGRFDRAVRLASEVLEELPAFGPALWVRAVSNGANFAIQRADDDFGRLVELPGLARAYRWHLVVVAPEMMTGAGRPDLGARYVLPGAGALPTGPSATEASDDKEGGSTADAGSDEESAARGGEPVSSRASKWTFEPSNPPVSRAVVEEAYLGRVEVALELGRIPEVRRMIEQLPEMRVRSGEAELLRAEFAARQGRRPAGPKDWQWDRASREERLVDAYYAGRFEKALQVGRALMDETATGGRTTRMVALSYAATDRGRRALRTVSEAETSVRAAPATERVRARILARLGGADAPTDRTFERFEDLEPTSVEAAVDLAAVGLWVHQVDAAERWSRAAVRRAPAHPEANWLKGLVLRMRGERDDSESYFRRSWRARDESPRLSLELGYVHLAERQYERARDLFFRALLADPESLEAIRGLGRAYHGFDDDEGTWNFQRILKNYQSDEDRAVHAAEVHRWLAVFQGSRSGSEEALEHLEEARSLAGDRPQLLLELARYREARGELESARKWYMDALERDATLAPAHLGLAKIAGKRDNTRGKRTHLRRYLDLHPEGADADWARDALRDLRDANSDEE